jgi:hypothetical protein
MDGNFTTGRLEYAGRPARRQTVYFDRDVLFSRSRKVVMQRRQMHCLLRRSGGNCAIKASGTTRLAHQQGPFGTVLAHI